MCVPNEQLAHSLCGTPEYMAPEVVVQEGNFIKLMCKKKATTSNVIGGVS